jgi:hypothetical protein
MAPLTEVFGAAFFKKLRKANKKSPGNIRGFFVGTKLSAC